MPYIRTIPPPEATGKLKEIYESGGGPSAARVKVAMIRPVQSLNPDALMAWSALGAGTDPRAPQTLTLTSRPRDGRWSPREPAPRRPARR